MINGVVEIVAAVLFAVVFLLQDRSILWLWIAGVYLVFGIGNLVIYAVKNYSKVRSARKQAAKSAKQAEESAKAVQQLEQKKASAAVAAAAESLSLNEAEKEI